MTVQDLKVRISAEIGAFRRDMEAAAKAAEDTANRTEKAGKKADAAGKGFESAGAKADGAGKKQKQAGESAKQAGEQSEQAGRKAESGMGRLAQTAERHEKAWNQVSTGLVAGGAAITAGLTASTMAAMEWESAFAGVKKTFDGTPEQLAETEKGLRGLAKTLPSTHVEIAGVAEAAGQLGVAGKDVTGFTKTMIDLGESTNLTAEDAATNIAQISNVMGTMSREGTKGIERFGSTLVALGNDGASTEAEILSMAQRIAGAGATLGATEADVLALSNTLASMGVRAELGGGVTTRVLLKMRSAVDEGGESLDAFAKISGLAADDFASKFKSAPMEALDLVAKGINRVNQEGGNVTATLKDMGIKGTEEVQVMLALANSGDLLSDSLKLGSKAWEENTALAKEAGERYKTAESRVRIAWNNIKDAAIDAGADILPVVATLADGVAGLVDTWQSLPGPVKSAVTVLGGAVGVAALVGGAFMKLAPSVMTTVTGLQKLYRAVIPAKTELQGLGKSVGAAPGGFVKIDAAMSRTEKNMHRVSKAAKVMGLAIAGAAVAGAFDGGEAGASVDEFINRLTDAEKTGKSVNDSLNGLKFGSGFAASADDVGQAIEQMNRGFMTGYGFEDFMLGMVGAESYLDELTGTVGAYDQAVTQLAQGGNTEAAAKAFREAAESAKAQGVGLETTAKSFPMYLDSLRQIANETETKVEPFELLEWAMSGVAPAAVQAAQASKDAASGVTQVGESAALTAKEIEDLNTKIDNFYDNMVNLGMVVIGENEAIRRLQETINSASSTITENGKVVKENGDAFDKTSQKYLESASALDGIASSTLSVIDPMRQAGATTADLATQIAYGRENFIKQAVAMGYSEKAAAAYADQLNLIPGNVYIQFDSNTDNLASKLTEIHELVQSTPDGNITITENSPEVKSALESLGYIVTTLPDGKIKVSETGTDATGKKIDSTAGKKRTAKIDAVALVGAAEQALAGLTRTRTMTIVASMIPGAGGAIAAGIRAAGGYTGGLVGRLTKGLAGGGLVPGQIPLNSQGDNVLATVGGKPFGLRSGEMVVNEDATRKNYPLLQAINDGAVVKLPGLASGGVVGRAQDKVDRLQRQYSRMSGSKANRNRKLDLKDDLDAAKRELAAAKKSAKDAEKRAKDAKKKAEEARKAERERQGRLSEARFDLRRDLKRGEIIDSFTSGSGMSVVDRLFEQSFNKDLSKGKRSALRRTAYGMESQLLSLEKRSESLTKKLDDAVKKRDELLSAQRGVQSSMVGAFDLGGLAGQTNQWGYKTRVGKAGLLSSGKDLASGAKKLKDKVSKLQKLGFGENMLNQVIEEWTSSGTFELADAMLSMNKSERGSFIGSFKSLEKTGLGVGEALTKSMSRGGINAAEGLVAGLESQQDKVDSAFYKLGKSAEKSFKKSLGIKSPSRVMFGAGEDSGEGAALGGLSKITDIESAFGAMSDAASGAFQPNLALSVPPPSMEVARYAAAQSAPMGIDSARLESMIASAVERAVGGWQVEVGGSPRTKAEWYQQGKRHAERTR